MKYLAMSVLVAAFLCPAYALAGGPAFTELAVGESMTVHFHSQGCFHNQRLYFVFERTAEGVKASLWNDTGRRDEDGKESVRGAGSTVLTQEQLAALDRTLTFYRGAADSGCTTVDQIHITWKRARTPDEKYTDGSCSIHAKKELLNFTALAAHITAEHAKRSSANPK